MCLDHIVVFKGFNETLVAYKIIPQEGTSFNGYIFREVYNFDDSKRVEAETIEDALKTLEEFKKNPTGGSYEYNRFWGYDEDGQELGYYLSVDFRSFDNKNIEAVIFYVKENIFEMAHEKELKRVFAEINKRAKVIAATQKTDYYTDDYHELDVIEEILSGNVHTKYEYKFL